jgi:LysR family glycine cleavage system transcriptional activator
MAAAEASCTVQMSVYNARDRPVLDRMVDSHTRMSRHHEVAMVNPYRPLPGLPPLRTFEAVARQASFTRAADELAITQSAVSHQIRSLERDLGVALFRRLNPGIALTDDGRTLLEGVRAGFDAMLLATERVRSRHRVGMLTVAAPGAFATWWLVPRLGRFAAAHPHIEIRIAVMDHRESDFRRDGIDTAVVMRAPRSRAPCEMLLLREKIFPVCSPALVRGENPLRVPADLAHHTLIEEDEPAGPGLDWSSWLSHVDQPERAPIRRLRFSQFGVALSAAIDGLGVALGRSPLVDAELAAGRLVRPFRKTLSMAAPNVFALTWAEDRASDPRLAAFRDFVLDEACGCELAAGPCGLPPSQRDRARLGWASARAVRRSTVATAI